MEVDQDLGCDSDEEVFFGKLTLAEVKKRILRGYKDLSWATNQRNDCNEIDFKIIETRSEPNIRKDFTDTPVKQLKSTSESQFMSSVKQKSSRSEFQYEDSFLQIEEHLTSRNNLDSTLDAVDFILNNAPSFVQKSEDSVKVKIKPVEENCSTCNVEAPKDIVLSQSSSQEESIHKNIHQDQKQTSLLSTPTKDKHTLNAAPSSSKNIKHETASAMKTPRLNTKGTPTMFRTPKLPLSHRKDEHFMKTPSKSKAYEHIASPIATYIKNCPQAPLLKVVQPTKKLPSTLIPKLVKGTPQTKMSNKENVMLPSLAYRSAKKTTVMNTDKDNWPQTNWPKKLPTSLTKPVVLKHDHRETSKEPPSMSQQDSFADLTLQQADVSICTQKIAFNNS